VLNLSRKLTSYAGTMQTFRQARIRYSSIFLYPIRRRGRNARCEVELENGMSLVSAPDEPLIHLVKEVFVDDCYRLGGLWLQPGETIVDVGANVGTFALAAARAFPQAPIICLEPEASAYALLEDNIRRNRLTQVRTINTACGGAAGEQVLYARRIQVNAPTSLSTLFTADNYGSVFEPMTTVPVITLDQLFKEHEIDTCGLLKLDCEGSEYEIVLNASRDTLSKIRHIAMEYHVGLTDHEPNELVQWLGECGFAVDRQPLLDEEGGYLYAWRETSA
jgi:FkbM family methyltransferase